jgi:hypothetical protein
MGANDNPILRWITYQLAWWIVKRKIRQNRAKLIAVGVIGLVVAGGALAARSASD